MSARTKTLMLNVASLALAAGLALSAGSAPAFAAELSPEDIVKALKPAAHVTRSLTTSPADVARKAEETRFVDTLRNRTSRSLTTAEREQITTMAQKKPSIDLEINFDYNSATIGNKGTPQVTTLGKALSSDDLKGSTFIVAGYTDAKGGDTYNQGLSERRADAVKQFLAEKYGIDAANLVTVGYGKSHLKNGNDPFSADNRRVQVINMSDK